MQKYPRGSRGSPAKGVVWETVARVRISSSAPKNAQALSCAFFGVERLVRTRELSTSSREPQGNVFSFFRNFSPCGEALRLAQYVVFCAIWVYHVRVEIILCKKRVHHVRVEIFIKTTDRGMYAIKPCFL